MENLSQEEEQILIASLRLKFEMLPGEWYNGLQSHKELYLLCLKLGLTELAEEINQDTYTETNVYITSLI